MRNEITVDMTPGLSQPILYYSQNDVGTELVIKLKGADIPAGATITLRATKPSGFGFTAENPTVSGNTVTFITTEDMTDEYGRFPAELNITSEGVSAGTANFIMAGEKNPHPEGTTDGQVDVIIPELTQLVERVEDAASSVLDRQTVTNTLSAGSQASYSFDEETNTQTFGIPQGEAGAGAVDVTASAYSSSKTYAVGDYVIHNDYLYRCTTAITTAEAWTSGHWTQVLLANEVSDVKSTLDIFINSSKETFQVIANGARRFSALFLKGVKYKFTNNTSDTCTFSLYKADGTAKLIHQPVNKDASVTFVVDDGGYVGFGGWMNGSGTVTIETDFSSLYDNRLINIYDYTNNFDWEVGSIYGDNGTNYNAPTYCIRTPNPYSIVGRYIENDCIGISVNPLIETIFAFKYSTAGAFIERLGSFGSRVVALDGGYSYRIVLIAKDTSAVIDAITIGNYSKDCFICGEQLADFIENTYESETYIVGKCIGTDLLEKNIKVKRVGNGNLLHPDSFLIYNGKYYSAGEGGIGVQSASFAVEQSISLSIGHGNAFVLGSTNKGYVSGWNDNKVYVIDLDNITIDSVINLPTTGYTTCAVDDVKGVVYIFQRDTYPSTEELYNFIVYDYVNGEVISTSKTSVPFAAMQACDIYHDKIAVINGLGAVSAPNGFRIYDTKGQVLTEITIADFTTKEPEGVFFDRSTKKLYMCNYNGAVYELCI